MGLDVELRGYVESICPGGLVELLSKTQNEVRNFFKKLAWETYAFEHANEAFIYPLMESMIFRLILTLRPLCEFI